MVSRRSADACAPPRRLGSVSGAAKGFCNGKRQCSFRSVRRDRREKQRERGAGGGEAALAFEWNRLVLRRLGGHRSTCGRARRGNRDRLLRRKNGRGEAGGTRPGLGRCPVARFRHGSRGSSMVDGGTQGRASGPLGGKTVMQ